MFYLIEKDGVYRVQEITSPYTHNYDAQYNRVCKEAEARGENVRGQFGRRDYAEKWAQYYNTGGWAVNGPMKI